MSAYRQAMLSIPPERLEQFSLEVKQNIAAKKSKKSQSHHKHVKSKKSDKKYRNDKSSIGSSTNSKASSRTRKRNSIKKHKSHKKRRKSISEHENLTDDSDVEENGLNLSFPLYPLSHYVKDRQNLCDILFRIVKGTKLLAMLPDILKEIPIEELKQKCLLHLEVMSSKRINHILLGEAMQSSSGTESEEEQSGFNEAVAKEEFQKPGKSSNSNEENYNLQTNFVDSTTSSGCEVLSLLAAGSKRDNEQQENNEANVVLESENIDSSSSSSKSSIHSATESDIEEEIETVEIVEDEEYVNMVDEILEETLVPSDDPDGSSTEQSNKTKQPTDNNLSQLELLELQLRARAIKSLMKATQSDKNCPPK